MEFYFYQLNHIWYLEIKDKNGNIIDKSDFDDFFNVRNVIEIATQLGKANNFKVNVDFTNKLKGE